MFEQKKVLGSRKELDLTLGARWQDRRRRKAPGWPSTDRGDQFFDSDPIADPLQVTGPGR